MTAPRRRVGPLDPDKVRVAIRKLSGEGLLTVLDRAIDALPPEYLAKLLEDYVSPDKLRPDETAPKKLVETVKGFYDASLRGEYFESFNVNSKNFMQKSRGTQTWIAECHRLLDLCVEAARAENLHEAHHSFGLIFQLLRQIDEGSDSIVFFADEAGSWQVGVNWNKVLPAWFKCLAPAVGPEEYARETTDMVDHFVHYDREKLLKQAFKIATPEQRRAFPSERRSSPG